MVAKWLKFRPHIAAYIQNFNIIFTTVLLKAFSATSSKSGGREQFKKKMAVKAASANTSTKLALLCNKFKLVQFSKK